MKRVCKWAILGVMFCALIGWGAMALAGTGDGPPDEVMTSLDRWDKADLILQHRNRALDAIRFRAQAAGNCPIVATIPSPDEDNEGLAWDGKNLWVSQGFLAAEAENENKVFKLDEKGKVLSSFKAPGEGTSGLAFDGTNFWLVDLMDGKINKINTSGKVLGSIPTPEGLVTGLAWDGTNLWVSEWLKYQIHKLDPKDGKVLQSFDSPGKTKEAPTLGLAWDGAFLWATQSSGGSMAPVPESSQAITGAIYKLNPKNGAVVGKCESDEFFGSFSLTFHDKFLFAGSWLEPSILKVQISSSPALPTVTINATDPTASEPGTDKGVFKVSRTGSTTNALVVKYSVKGTATAVKDYKKLLGTVTIPAKKAFALITVTPVDDKIKENPKTVIVTLSKTTTYTIGSPNNATVTINDND